MATIQTVFAVEHGEYSSRKTLCLFVSEASANEYIQRISAAEHEAEMKRWGYGYYDRIEQYVERYEIVPYQLWHTVPVVTVSDNGWAVEPMPLPRD